MLDERQPNVKRAQFIIDDNSFAQQTGRNPGEESKSSFLRKGIAGDWRNHFTPEAAEIFDHYCGDALIATGYEPDRSWIDSLDKSNDEFELRHERETSLVPSMNLPSAAFANS